MIGGRKIWALNKRQDRQWLTKRLCGAPENTPQSFPRSTTAGGRLRTAQPKTSAGVVGMPRPAARPGRKPLMGPHIVQEAPPGAKSVPQGGQEAPSGTPPGTPPRRRRELREPPPVERKKRRITLSRREMDALAMPDLRAPYARPGPWRKR